MLKSLCWKLNLKKTKVKYWIQRRNVTNQHAKQVKKMYKPVSESDQRYPKHSLGLVRGVEYAQRSWNGNSRGQEADLLFISLSQLHICLSYGERFLRTKVLEEVLILNLVRIWTRWMLFWFNEWVAMNVLHVRIHNPSLPTLFDVWKI